MRSRNRANGEMPPVRYRYNVAMLVILKRANPNADEKLTIQADFLLRLLV